MEEVIIIWSDELQKYYTGQEDEYWSEYIMSALRFKNLSAVDFLLNAPETSDIKAKAFGDIMYIELKRVVKI